MPDSPVRGAHAALLFLHAQTALHPGSGTSLGAVDLPVQRERHTEWPIIPGSSIKGVMRDACREEAAARKNVSRREANEQDDFVVAAFGPSRVEEGTAHAGGVSFTDARLLAFPVRSLRGVFAWVTCHAVIGRLNRDLKLAGLGSVDAGKPPGKNQAAVASESPLLVGNEQLVLEEFEFARGGDAGKLPDWLAANATDDPGSQKQMRTHLTVLHDDDFTHFARHATEVVARVALDYEKKKTVKKGALFYQEFVPAESLFYSVVLAGESRREGTRLTADDLLENLANAVPDVIQIGGDATTGKGLCSVRFSRAKE